MLPLSLPGLLPTQLKVFWLLLIFYGMPAKLDRFAVPTQCDYFKAHSPSGFCCPLPMTTGGTPQCFLGAGGYWSASECMGHITGGSSCWSEGGPVLVAALL